MEHTDLPNFTIRADFFAVSLEQGLPPNTGN